MKKLLWLVPLLAIMLLGACTKKEDAVLKPSPVPLLTRVGSLESRTSALEIQIGKVDKLQSDIAQLRTELQALKAQLGK